VLCSVAERLIAAVSQGVVEKTLGIQFGAAGASLKSKVGLALVDNPTLAVALCSSLCWQTQIE
jgi:hypothetical protein